MREFTLFGFLFGMWILILIGGGITVVILGPISITGFGDFNKIISSGIQTIVAIILVAIWILALSKLKNYIFKRQLKS